MVCRRVAKSLVGILRAMRVLLKPRGEEGGSTTQSVVDDAAKVLCKELPPERIAGLQQQDTRNSIH